MGAGGAGTAGRHVGSAQAIVNGEHTRGHVQNEHWDHEWRHAPGAAVHQDSVLVFLRGQAADAAADETANLVTIQIFQHHVAVAQRLPRSEDTQLCEAVRPAHLLGRGKRGVGVKVLQLRGDLATVVGDIKRRDALNAAPSRDDFFPERLSFRA